MDGSDLPTSGLPTGEQRPGERPTGERPSIEPPHVVIVGAGFGGLAAAKELADALVRVTLVVTVNGTPVTLDMNNGWWLLDDGRTFTLNGSACGNFRMNPGSSLNASFPCDSGVIIID